MVKQIVKISIGKDTVYTEVDKHTSYEGAKTDASLYDKVRVNSNDKTMLERWWCDACGLVTTMLTPYVTEISAYAPDSDGDFEFTLSMPYNWNSAQTAVIKAICHEVVCDYILQQWYQLLNLEALYKEAAEKQQSATAKMAVALYDRKRPARPTYTEIIEG